MNEKVVAREGIRTMESLPVIDVDTGARLGFKNPKNVYIHVARVEEPPDADIGAMYAAWAICGGGSARHSEEDAFYIEPDEFDNDFIQRDGEVVGKLCGNCKKLLNSEDLFA